MSILRRNYIPRNRAVQQDIHPPTQVVGSYDSSSHGPCCSRKVMGRSEPAPTRCICIPLASLLPMTMPLNFLTNSCADCGATADDVPTLDCHVVALLSSRW